MISRLALAAAALLVTATNTWAIDLTVLAPAGYTPASGFAAGADLHKQLYDEFQAQNPDITLKFEVLEGGPAGLQKLLTAAGSNTLTDVTVVDGQWIPRLVQSDILQPLDTLWPEEDRADFHPAVIAAETVDGKPYAIMFQTGMRGLLYRPERHGVARHHRIPQDVRRVHDARRDAQGKGHGRRAGAGQGR